MIQLCKEKNLIFSLKSIPYAVSLNLSETKSVASKILLLPFFFFCITIVFIAIITDKYA